ncbi:MAG: SDR family NAD(P)-dependent oxidoreductase [Chloroherpetonaceae bacterium]|nr:SDR family NAD(P)-dependent oxidoreductase [Chloroherpetonaceae bacterium]
MKNITIVTGANSGIGFETAKALAKDERTLFLICRTEEKANIAAEKIKAALQGELNADILGFACDFSSQKQIRALAEKIKSKAESVSILVNNAGAIFPNRELTEDGLEKTFAVNHLGYFLLTLLLERELKQLERSRVVSVASEASRVGVLEFEDLSLEKSFSSIRAYGQSKLMNILFAFALARKWKENGVTSTVMHPGGVNTGFGEGDFGLVGSLFKLAKPFFRTPEKGAETVIWLAKSAEVEGISGKYFQDLKEIQPISMAKDIALQEKLWELSLELVKLK